jgi:hypothetical protein
MSRWYTIIERYECRECGEEVSKSAATKGSCPHCGWNSKKQSAFDKRMRQ